MKSEGVFFFFIEKILGDFFCVQIPLFLTERYLAAGKKEWPLEEAYMLKERFQSNARVSNVREMIQFQYIHKTVATIFIEK